MAENQNLVLWVYWCVSLRFCLIVSRINLHCIPYQQLDISAVPNGITGVAYMYCSTVNFFICHIINLVWRKWLGQKFKYWAVVCSCTYVHMHVWVWALFYPTTVISHCLLAWLYYTYAYTMATIFCWLMVSLWVICLQSCTFCMMQMQNTTDAGSVVYIQTTIYKYVKSSWATDCILDSERTCMRHIASM